MKVGLVGTHPVPTVERPSDGHGARLARLAEAMAARGADVIVYSVRPQGAGPDLVSTEKGYRIADMPGPGGTAYASDTSLAPVMGEFAQFIVRRLAADRPDVVHARSWMYGVAAQVAADRLGIASVQSLPELSAVVHRRQERVIGPASRARFERLLVRSATRATVSCEQDVVELIGLGCRRVRVSVLPEAVDTELFCRAPVGDRGDIPRIVTVARELKPHKGIEDIIGALKRLPDAELVIGGGPLAGRVNDDVDVRRLRTVAADHGVAERVRFAGWIPQSRLPQLLRSADVFVSASWYEPFGLPVLEAMSCGVPVVATAAGGMLDTVVGDVTGLSVPQRDPIGLAKAIAEVLHGGPLRRGMGLAGRGRACSRYGWDHIAAETEAVFERAMRDVGVSPRIPSRVVGA